MEELMIFMNAQKKENDYDANAIFSDGKVVIKAGSKISPKVNINFKMAKQIIKLRENKEYIDENLILKDMEFESLSRAACFVAGYSVNGRNAWKTQNGKSIKYILEEN
ncbi:MAG: DUF4357 domain-containing protein [Erysipelotrichia bacterium]|nr:DUF4357 domain-containing protein [Erysipelotrichia bacterium]